MTTFLYSNIVLTAGADRMAEIDPHGWILSLTSVFVVFSALVLLYCVYSLSGAFFSGKFDGFFEKLKRKPKAPKGKAADAEVAAAIAMALQAEMGSETEVAIATALHLYLSDAIHDVEPGFITIKRTDNSNWKFRK